MQSATGKKIKIGVVASNGMDKSVTVTVERTVLDDRFKKYVRRNKKFMAHDESNECRVGDKVSIRECRPLSKRKRWRIDSIIKKASDVE
jgi:small subunit ribosomal protein S17